LEFERGGSFAGGMLRALHSRLGRLAVQPGPNGSRVADDAQFAARYADIAADIDANDMLELSGLSRLEGGAAPGAAAAAVLKIQRSRIRQAIAELQAYAVGPDAIRWQAHRPLHELPEAD